MNQPTKQENYKKSTELSGVLDESLGWEVIGREGEVEAEERGEVKVCGNLYAMST